MSFKIVLIAVICISRSFSVGAQEYVKSFQHNYFAGEKVQLALNHVDVPATAKRTTVKLITHSRTLFHRTADVKRPLEFTFPPIKDGVKVNAELVLSFIDGDGTLVREQKFSLLFHSRNQTVGFSEALKKLNIGVFGNNKGFVQLLESNFIPFTCIDDLEAFDGKWAICSGIELDEDSYRVLTTLQQQGTSIIIVAPVSGEIPFLGNDNSHSLFVLAGNERIHTFGKELDELKACSGFELIPYGSVIGLKVSDNLQWNYCEIQGKNNGARIILCGWDLEPRNPSSILWILNILKK